jgi:hypothetical protein
MSDKFVNQLASPTLPLADNDYVITSRNGVALNASLMQNVRDYVRQGYYLLAAQTTSSNTVFTNLTDLQFSVINGRRYFFEYTVRYQAAATATGIVFTMTNPTGIITATVEAVVGADGTAAGFHGGITSSGDIVSTGTVAAANTDTVMKVSGYFVAQADGTVIPQFRSSAGGSNVIVQVGSAGFVMQG